MNGKDLKKVINELPDDAIVVVAKPFVIDEHDEITAILDIPVTGIAVNDQEKEKEIRFILGIEDIKQCFSPQDVQFFDESLKPEFEEQNENN